MNVIKKHMLHKAIKKFDYGDLVNLPLSLQDTCVLAIGPKSCIRIFYFQAKKKNYNNKLYMLPVSEIQLISAEHLKLFEQAVEEIFNRSNYKNLIVLIMCSDIILGNNFESVIRYSEKKHNKNIKLFKRGPLVDNMMCPKERMISIVDSLY